MNKLKFKIKPRRIYHGGRIDKCSICKKPYMNFNQFKKTSKICLDCYRATSTEPAFG